MQATHYERIGGEDKVLALVTRFYDLMDTLPEAYGIRKMHPQDLASSRQKLFEFLSGWMGGPQLFIEKYGHPRLRARHMPFAVDASARDQWMMCMRQALAEVVDDKTLAAELEAAFYQVADFMQNQGGGPAAGMGGIQIR